MKEKALLAVLSQFGITEGMTAAEITHGIAAINGKSMVSGLSHLVGVSAIGGFAVGAFATASLGVAIYVSKRAEIERKIRAAVDEYRRNHPDEVSE